MDENNVGKVKEEKKKLIELTQKWPYLIGYHVSFYAKNEDPSRVSQFISK